MPIILKIITVILFLVAFMAQSFDRVLIVTDYFARTSAYAKNCENKKKPQMRCQGKCQMMKKLEQQEKDSQSNPERKLENKQEVLACGTIHQSDFSLFTITSRSFNLPVIGKVIDISSSLLRPPATHA